MKRILLALAVGVALFATVAFAASLGGITTASLGASTAVVSSCDTDGVSVEWGTHVLDAVHGDANHPNGGFFIHNFDVKGISADCAGKHVLVSLTVSGNHVQFCISGAIPASGDGDVSVSFPNAYQNNYPALPSCLNDVTVWADELTDVHIAIKDTPY